MNYNKIILRGSKYTNAALWNWSGRKDKLISLWCNTEDQYVKQKADNIISEIDKRVRGLVDLEIKIKEQIKQNEREAMEMYIKLECPSMACRYALGAVGMAVRTRDYIPGKLKCKICGSALEDRSSRGVAGILFDLKIKI